MIFRIWGEGDRRSNLEAPGEGNVERGSAMQVKATALPNRGVTQPTTKQREEVQSAIVDSCRVNQDGKNFVGLSSISASSPAIIFMIRSWSSLGRLLIRS